MKKILFIGYELPYLLNGTDYPVGGYIHRIKKIIASLFESNCDVKVITWKNNNIDLLIDQRFQFIQAFDPNCGIKKIRWIYYRLPRIISSIKSTLDCPDVPPIGKRWKVFERKRISFLFFLKISFGLV